MECLTVLETARKWDLSPLDGAAPLHRRSHSRRAEVREVLGHPRRRGKAPGRLTCPKAGGDRGRRCSGPHRPHAPDEHPLPAGNVRGRGTGHGGRPPAGHRLGGILLLHRPAGQSGAGGGGVCGGHLFRAAPPLRPAPGLRRVHRRGHPHSQLCRRLRCVRVRRLRPPAGLRRGDHQRHRRRQHPHPPGEATRAQAATVLMRFCEQDH